MTLQSYTEQKMGEYTLLARKMFRDGMVDNVAISAFITTAIEGAAQKVLWEAGQQVEKLPDDPMNWKEAVGSILHRTALQDEPK